MKNVRTKTNSSRLLVIQLLAVVALLAVLANGASAQPVPDPVLHYSLDEGAGVTAFDSSITGANGTLVNNPTWILGQSGNALSFDGVSNYVSTGYATNLAQWTVAAWVRSPASPGSGAAAGPVHREKNFAISWDHPAAAFRGSAAMSVGGTWYAASFGALSPNTWYHLAATYDGETLIAYRDGVPITTNTAPSGLPDAESTPLTLGKNSSAPLFFNGDVDDVRLYAGALSATQIQSIMILLPDFTPPVISGVTITSSGTSATVTWTTDEPSDSGVNYGTTTALGTPASNTAVVTNHSVTLTGLTLSTTYFVEVSSRDPSGNLAVDDNGGLYYSFTTAAVNTISPAVLLYKFDEGAGAVAFDSSGGGNDATLINGPAWIAGQTGTALSFDGTTSYADTGYTTDLPQWTVAAWVRSPAAPGSVSATGPIHREKNFIISWDHPNAAFRGAAALSVAGTWYSASFGALSPNTWYHLAATYDGETLQVFKDGVLADSNTTPSGAPDSESATLTIGKHSLAPIFFQGDVDQVQIFAEALTESEIVGLMVPDPDFTPPVISAVAVSPSSTTATITWTTDEPSDSGVNYGTTVALGTNVLDSALVTSHSVTLTGLTPSVSYMFEVTSQDASTNQAIDDNGGALYQFATTPTPPAPTISSVLVTNITDNGATVTWTTDVASDSQVDYGTTPALGATVTDTNLVTTHSVNLASLTRGTLYSFAVTSTGEGGTTVENNGGTLYNFTTTDVIAVSNIRIEDLTATSATVRWNTNVPVHASVERNVTPDFLLCPFITYEPQSDPHYCTVWNQFPTTSPEIRLAALAPNTTYHFAVRSALGDGGDIYTTVAPFSFTTLGLVGAPVDRQISTSTDDAFDVPGDPLGYQDASTTIVAGVPAVDPATGGWRWTGLNIPAGAVITEAWVEMIQDDFGVGFVSRLALENSANPATFSLGSTPADRWLNRTAFDIEWPWPHTDQPGSLIRTASLVQGVQELVDLYNGIDTLAVLEYGADVDFHAHNWSAYDQNPAFGAKLHIQYRDTSDFTPPVISFVNSSPSATTAVITWTTDEPSDSEVNYGTTSGLGSSSFDPTFGTNHTVVLSNLTPSTQYFFEVLSVDSNSNLTVDDNGGLLYSLTTFATPRPPSGLTLRYDLDEGSGTVAFDSSGNANDGTLLNAPQWIPGLSGTALSFDGVGSYVESGFATDLAEWSVALWVNSSAAPGGGSPTGPVHREKNFVISWDHPSPAYQGAAALSVAGTWYSASFGALAANTWYHLTATYDGETLKAYRDGVLVTTNGVPSGPPDSEAVTMKIGKNSAADIYFAGEIDDVQIYGRALANWEVLELGSFVP